LQDGTEVKRSERLAALQVADELHARLCAELRAEGVDPEASARAEDDSGFDEGADVPETGYRVSSCCY
jgi:hypothetical protein